MNLSKVILKYWRDDSQKNISPFTIDQFSKIEKLVSNKLPDDLIQFLSEFSGVDLGTGTIDDPIAFFIAKVANGTKFFAGVETDKYTTSISYFSTFEDMSQTYKRLTRNSEHYEAGPRVPAYMLPIDSDGTLFINLSESDYGEISVWGPIEETWGNEHNNSMDFVAGSFTEFVESLTTWANAEKKLANQIETERDFIGSDAWKSLMKKITGSDDPKVWEGFMN